MSHSLGRIPSPPDERDFRLENFLGLGVTASGTPQELAKIAETELKLTTITYRKWVSTAYVDVTTTHWYKALDAILTIENPLPPPPLPTGGVLWSDPEAVLDQLAYGTCVGQAQAQFLNTFPIDDKFTEGMGQSALAKGPYARAIYYEATVLDGSPDDPDAPNGGQQGATVRSGMQALKNRARVATFAQTTDLAVAETWLRTKGSISVGSDWLNDMFSPDPGGFVVPTGGVAGGHNYLWDEITDGGDYGFLNSWGSAWGIGGRFYMTKTNFAKLIASGGELWTAVELAL